MGQDEDLRKAILNRRSESSDRREVTYDLSSGIDFTEPLQVADSLSDVFAEKDLSSWFNSNGSIFQFRPDYNVKFKVARSEDDNIEACMHEFLGGLTDNDVVKAYIDDYVSINEPSSFILLVLLVIAIVELILLPVFFPVLAGFITAGAYVLVILSWIVYDGHKRKSFREETEMAVHRDLLENVSITALDS